jgi:Concanavalin A-like lectin/glucanases superfamily
MNAAGNSKSFSAPVTLTIGVLVFVGILVGLYYLYRFMTGKTAARDTKQLFSGALQFKDCGDGSSTYPLVTNQNFDVQGITDGGEFTLNTWVYVSDIRSASVITRPIHLFEVSNRDLTSSTGTNKAILVGSLVPSTGRLVVRLGGSDSSETLTDATIRTLLTSDYTSEGKCDIPNIEYQRWILITTTVNSRTLDIYIDGKLARSCVYKTPYVKQSGVTKQKVYFGLGLKNMKGAIGSPSFSNYAMSPDEVWNVYMSGPDAGRGIFGALQDLFGIEIKYKIGDTTGSIST